MVRSFVSCLRIFPLLGLAVAAACSSDPSEPGNSNGGQPSSAGSSGAGTAGAAAGSSAQGGSTAQGGSGNGGGGASGGSLTTAGTGGGSAAGTGGSAGASTGGSAGAGGGTGGASGGSGGMPTMLEPCAMPSVSHLKVWEMQVVGGTQVPANGSPLRKIDGSNAYELHVEWTLTDGGAYGTANAPINNMGQYTNGADPAKNAVDISKGDGLTIEYSSTGNTYLQLRTAAVPHGGDHFRADLPSTDGQIKTIKLAYSTFRRPGGNTPPANDVLGAMFSFTFVGGGSTKLTLRQVLIPGFVPPC